MVNQAVWVYIISVLNSQFTNRSPFTVPVFLSCTEREKSLACRRLRCAADRQEEEEREEESEEEEEGEREEERCRELSWAPE
jgi:hypothetical protein